jgi:hypothetical protein
MWDGSIHVYFVVHVFTPEGFGYIHAILSKALHSKLLTELSSQFLSRNKFFASFEFRVERNFL